VRCTTQTLNIKLNQTNSTPKKEITLEQLVLLIGTSVKSGIQEFQNDLQTKDSPRITFQG
jgi:hypothetical protein